MALAVRDDGQPNRLVHTLQPLAAYFTANYWDGVYPADVLYRPITTLSVAVLHWLWGRHATGEHGQALPQHLANVLLHVLATWLAVRLARRAGLTRGPSLVAGVVFGLHAVHSEVVAGIVGRSELLAFVFGAAATLLVTGAQPLRWPRLVLAAVLAFLAFASKENAVAWPAVMLLLGVLRVRTQGAPIVPLLGRVALVVGPSLALFLALRADMIAHLPPAAPGEGGDAWSRRLIGTVGWARGLLVCLFPFHLACDHGPATFTVITSPLQPLFLAAAAALAAVAALAIATWRRAPAVAAGCATFLLSSFIVSNVPFTIGVRFAERLYYTPSLGICILAGALAQHLAERARDVRAAGSRAWLAAPAARRGAAVLLAVWLAWSAGMVLRRNPVWQDDAALFAHEYANQPRSARIAVNWAGVLRQQGRDAEMEQVLRRVVQLDPDLATAWNELGVRAQRAGRPAEAAADFVACLAARKLDSDVHKIALENLVRVHLAAAQPAAAVAAVEQYATSAPATVARAFATLQDLLGPHVTADWLVEVSRRLEGAAPQARGDWNRLRAVACYTHQAYPAAVAFLRQWLAEAATLAERQQATLLLGSTLASMGELAEARQTLLELQRMQPLPAETASTADGLMRRLDREPAERR